MTDIEKEPSIGVSYTVELPGKKALVLQSFVPRDCEPAMLDSVLDKVRLAADRQEAFGLVDILKRELEQQEKLAADHAKRIAVVDQNIKNGWANKRGDPQLSNKQRQDQEQAYAYGEECKLRIAKVKQDIAMFEAKTRLPEAKIGA